MTLQQTISQTDSVSRQQSLILIRNLLRTAISSISYIRHIFPEDCFQDRLLSGMNVKSLLPTCSESKLVIDWLEQGLRSLVFGLYLDPSKESTLIECYSFNIAYDQNDFSIDLVRQTETSNISKVMSTKEDIKQATIAMIRTLISLAQTLSPIPKNRFLVMKLFYYDDITPTEYEPAFFRPATNDESMAFHFKPLKLNLGHVETPYHRFNLQIRTTIDVVDSLNALVQSNETKPSYPLQGLYEPHNTQSNVENHQTESVSRNSPINKQKRDESTKDQSNVEPKSKTISVVVLKRWFSLQDMSQFNSLVSSLQKNGCIGGKQGTSYIILDEAKLLEFKESYHNKHHQLEKTPCNVTNISD
ncbi:putative Meiosis-specific protein PAIR2 [Blattamonas nauphoetae]|uniref:Meiosis-specific protein PAIR2 n=1 Tax=Blattamonas nauphoetae TaxID=2049346 RepID=A0ABQ9Y167_9EUKA|nr:putative Meiosis-specific protein PAIR2 [Blattamonas nauphoetae]